jgi:hypothetical protein
MRLAVLAAAALALTTTGAFAQSRCKVMDPTGTPLNIRTAPNGAVVGQASNGALVSVIDRATDGRGRPWVYIAHRASGEPLGWVFREFIACY